MRDLGLPDRIRAKGVEVVLVPGWESRGSSSYSPRGTVNHHTAGGASGATPSLGICTYGRSDLAGPLCQVLQSRGPGQDKAYIIASGRANHAGRGGYRGLAGNSSVSGLEIEHIGTTSVPIERLEVAARIQAALLEAPGSSRDAGFLAQHFEWTDRKIDFNNLAPHFTPASFRARVQFWIGRTTTSAPTPAPQKPKEYTMPYNVITCKERGPQYFVLTPNGAKEVPGGDAAYEFYLIGVDQGVLKPVKQLTMRQFDVAKALCNGLA